MGGLAVGGVLSETLVRLDDFRVLSVKHDLGCSETLDALRCFNITNKAVTGCLALIVADSLQRLCLDVLGQEVEFILKRS